jgi:hypothetical protein
MPGRSPACGTSALSDGLGGMLMTAIVIVGKHDHRPQHVTFHHWITRSARARKVCGKVNPNVRATLELTTSS